MNIPKLICILNYFFIFYIHASPVTLHFKSGLCKGNENTDFLSNYYNQYLYTPITIGSNNQKLELALKLNRYITYMIGSENSNLKSKYFNEKESNTYQKLSDENIESREDEFFGSYKSSDNIIFNDNLKINNYIFFLSQKQQYFDETGHIGLKMLPDNLNKKQFISLDFISQLKSKSLINSYYFYFKYNLINENDFKFEGNLIIGATPHEYEKSDLFQEKNFREAYAKIDEVYNTRWNLDFLEVKYDNKIISKNDLCEFSTTFGFIVAPVSFIDIYNDFFNRTGCYGKYNGDEDEKKYMYLYCEENIDITKFKNIIFTTKNKEIKFVLTYKDLFKKIGNYNYFLILFNEDINEWILGHIFLNKYTIVFNTEKRTIGYYLDPLSESDNSSENKKKSNTYIIFIVLSVIFLLVIIGLLVYIFYFRPRNRKIRPNELEENFDYTSNNEDNNNINNSQDNSKLGV